MNAAVRELREAKPLTSATAGPLIRVEDTPPPFPVDALASLRGPVEAIQRLTQAPMAIAAQSALGVAALAVQGYADVEHLGGSSPTSLFLMTVARSGERKSACDDYAMRGVSMVVADLRTDHETDYADWSARHAVWGQRRAAIEKSAKTDPETATLDLIGLGPEPPPPLQPVLTAAAPTLGGITRNLPGLRPSLGLFSDEGGQFLGGHALKAENKAETFTAFSALWNGRPVDRWRAGDGIATYPGRRLSAHLMLQREVADALLSDPLANGQGFLARWLIVEPPSRIGARPYREPDPDALAAVERFAETVASRLRRPLPLREGTRNELAPPVLPLHADARALLIAFHDAIEAELAKGKALAEVAAFGAKASEHAARLAGVLMLFGDPTADMVSAEVMADAIALAQHYLNEAARLMGAAPASQKVTEAECLRVWLQEKWGESFVAPSDVAHRGPNALRDVERARAALGVLERNGCVERCTEPVEIRGKRRREAYRVLPAEGVE